MTNGWIDLQVNGFAGIDFSAPGLSVDAVRRVTQALVAAGTERYCPTLVTAPLEAYRSNLPVLAAAMEAPDLRPHLLGIHMEGPFLAPPSCGAHRPDLLRLPDIALFDSWQRLAAGRIRLLTLAPELPDAQPLIRHAATQGVVVSIGHHLADEAAIAAAVSAGARCCTHLGNGIPNLLPRHPNPIWTQLAEDRLTGLFITDGHHLPASFVKTALRAKGIRSFIVTSDAASVAGLPPGRYSAMGGEVVIEPGGRVAMAGGSSLAGSSATLAQCMAWLRSLDLLSADECLQVGRRNALALLGAE